jgi:hypothetical protein
MSRSTLIKHRDKHRLGEKLEQVTAVAESHWIRSSYCTGSTCVEVAHAGGLIAVRDSKNPDRSVLYCTTDEWQAFTASVANGEFIYE